MQARPESFVAECYWPDVDDGDLVELDRRIDREISGLAPEGTAAAVRDVAERARIPFERILAAALAPWPRSNEGGSE